MNLLIFFLFVASCQGSIFRQPPFDKFEKALEEIVKDVFKHNFETIRPRALLDGLNETLQEIINSLEDPLEIEKLDLEISQSPEVALSGVVNLTNFKAVGQKGLKVPKLSPLVLGGLGVNLSLTLESFNLSTGYDIDLLAPLISPDFAFRGSGAFGLILEFLRLDISAHFNTTIVEGHDDVIYTLFGTIIEINFGQETKVAVEDDTTLVGGILALAVNAILKQIEDDPTSFSDVISPIIEDIANAVLLGVQGVPTS